MMKVAFLMQCHKNPEQINLLLDFIPQIAMYAAKRYNVPIVSCIGDDYYFNVEKTLNPIYHLYKWRGHLADH